MREKNPKAFTLHGFFCKGLPAVASRECFYSGLRSLGRELEMQRYRKKVFGHL